jgi:stage II sporulation protein AA (anti-sigma F factor antagonist)
MFAVRRIQDVVIVQPEIERLDELAGRQLVAQMRTQFGFDAKILLDLSDVQFVNSAALGYIITYGRRVRHQHGSLAVCSLQDHPRGVFKITRMARNLSGVYDTESQALDAMAEAGSRQVVPAE